MNSYKYQYIEYKNYYTAIAILESNQILDEGFFDSLSQGIKDKIEFIKSVAEAINQKVEDVVKLFKNSKVYKFFSTIKFNFTTLFDLVKKGFSLYSDIQKIISQYISNTKIGKWNEDKLNDLQSYLEKHPTIKRASGVVVAGMLLYIWLNMSFTGDFSYDFDFSDIIKALGGHFNLSSLFAGADGTRMLLLFATGVIGVSFPWPGPTSVKFIVATINGLKKLV